ncbi:MAG: thymidylate synthase [Candidatus Pacearchaeota archaeon]|jgi:thymidylate synthase|nr:thymidylate synthase [Clostridia bacterium]
METATKEFVRVIKKIQKSNNEVNPRGLKVKETLLEMMEIDPRYPIVDFKAREFPWKYLAGELGWYLRREKSLDNIKPFSSFWNRIADENGEINSNYGNLLFGKQLRWVYDSLVADIDTRQAVAFLNQPKFQYKGNKDFVCTFSLNFFVRKNKLNMKVTMRSNDIFFGFTFDAPFFSFVQQHMYLWLKETKYPDLELGTYYHFADNIHFYERHFDVANEITKELLTMPKSFILKKRMFDIDEDGEYSMTWDAKSYTEFVLHQAAEEATTEQYIEGLSNFFDIK